MKSLSAVPAAHTALALMLASAAVAAGADDVARKLSAMPRPWTTPMHRLTPEQYAATMAFWAREHGDKLKVSTVATSHSGLPVFVLRITDPSVRDDDKQVALVTALHGGPERSGSTTALHAIEWLLGSSPLARESRRKQIVLVLPIPNPHAFFHTDRWGNAKGIDLYDPPAAQWNLPALTLRHPQDIPELAAVLAVIDEHQPEVHIDLHGTGLQGYPADRLADRNMYEGRTRFEITACSYSNCTVRPWDWRVTEAMVAAGHAAGYGSDRAEADAHRTFWSADNDVFRERLWTPPRPARFRTPFYGYMKYHTMMSVTEVGWEESGVARIGGLIALGNRPWLDERVAGYPVNRVKARAARYVTAYGKNASERRRSRAELWQAQEQYAHGICYPEYDGRATYVVAVTPRGIAVFDPDLDKFVTNLRGLPGVRAEAIAHFLSLGPEFQLTGKETIEEGAARIQHGIGFRLRLPYRAPEIVDVAVNGHSLQESAEDGYEAWSADGYTQLQINLSPARAREADIFVVTAAYRGNETRSYGWKPPAAVLGNSGDPSR